MGLAHGAAPPRLQGLEGVEEGVVVGVVVVVVAAVAAVAAGVVVVVAAGTQGHLPPSRPALGTPSSLVQGTGRASW